MSGSKPGERRGGRRLGTKNKATLERERRAIEALHKKGAMAPLRALAKDQLAELVPVVKGIVARFQLAAMQAGAPGDDGYRPDFWKELRDWIKTYATVADLAADFESPRYRAIAVMDGTGGVGTPFVLRAPMVLEDSMAWQAAVGAAVIDMEASPAASGGRPEVLPVALPHPAQPQPSAPGALPVALTPDQKTGRITVMPPGPRVVQPAGSAEWLDSVAAQRKATGG
jgi:hypothetical protein